ncbi:hypothetical protein CEB3_c18600 [Peptococcaceae bacterium CEB3]|nr:hypothetical protein CEB3_c18600 [Peptococcaceae bacterium CEB3]
MIYDAHLGMVLGDNNVVLAIYDGKDVPVGCRLDADKTYYIESRGEQKKIRAKGDEALLLFLAGHFKLDTLGKAVIYEKKVDIRPIPLFRGEGVTAY